MRKRFGGILLFGILLIACNDIQSPTSGGNNHHSILVLKNGFLIDGSGSGPAPNSVVIIQDSLITFVGSDTSIDLPSGAEVIDLRGAYMLPGFMNTHVHSAYNAFNLREWAKSGVTTVRDLGNLTSTPEEGFAIRDTLLKDNNNARLVAAGPLVTTVGGYGNYPVTSVSDAEVKTNGLIDAGADLIKIAIEDDLQGRTWPMLSPAEIEMIVQTAHSRNKRVAAHISTSKHLGMAIDGDVDDVVHMIVDYLPDSLIAMMVVQNMYWVPTLELWKGVSERYNLNWITTALDNLGRFVHAGGKVALGTDYDGYITPFDLGMPITEIRLMRDAGMTPMQIIIAGTRNAAHVCHRENDLGTIEPGKIADILVVGDNPLNDLDALLNVRMVLHNGEIITE